MKLKFVNRAIFTWLENSKRDITNSHTRLHPVLLTLLTSSDKNRASLFPSLSKGQGINVNINIRQKYQRVRWDPLKFDERRYALVDARPATGEARVHIHRRAALPTGFSGGVECRREQTTGIGKCKYAGVWRRASLRQRGESGAAV